MTDKLKCPFCGAELKSCSTFILPNRYMCTNNCCSCSYQAMNTQIWQALIAGKKAQDALKVAISALGLVGNGKSDEQGICRFVDERNCENVRTICCNALTKITSITKQGK